MTLVSVTNQNGIATVSINNPPVNVLTFELINEINAFVLSMKDDRDTKVIVFKSLHESFFPCSSGSQCDQRYTKRASRFH